MTTDVGISALIIVIASIFIFRKSVMTLSKGFFAIALNNAYGILKSSLAMRIVSATSKRKVPKGLPSLVDYERVSSRAFRVLGLNPGPHTLQGTNTWLICGSKNRSDHILIDTGEDGTADEYIKLLFDKVFPEAGTKRLSKILLTHGHGDHQGGVVRLLDELKARNMLPLPTIYKRSIVNGKFPSSGFECENISDLDKFQVDEDTTLQACYTPGHTDDHVGFILHEDHAVLSGDCVLGCGTTVFDNLFEYMQSLRRIRKIITDSASAEGKPAASTNANAGGVEGVIQYSHNIHTIYPGHGPVIRGTALQKIDEYIAHRDAREAQILRLLGCPTQFSDTKPPTTRTSKGEDAKSTTDIKAKAEAEAQSAVAAAKEWHASWDITGKMYGELPFIVKLSAMHNVSHHLEKLQREGRVEARWPDLWRAKRSVEAE